MKIQRVYRIIDIHFKSHVCPCHLDSMMNGSFIKIEFNVPVLFQNINRYVFLSLKRLRVVHVDLLCLLHN
jgi:hypothetical protein